MAATTGKGREDADDDFVGEVVAVGDDDHSGGETEKSESAAKGEA